MGGHEVAIHVVVSVVGWRAMKMVASLLMIRGLEENYDPKTIEVTGLCGADKVL